MGDDGRDPQGGHGYCGPQGAGLRTRHVTVFQTNVEVRLTPSNVPLRAADDILRSPMNLQSEEAPMPVDPRHNSRKLLEGPDRVVARAMMKAVGFTDESLARPQIGIAHCWIGTMPCNWNRRQLAAYAAEGVRAAGGTPIEVNTIAINDGITTGAEGMKTSLVSREIIADSIELVGRGHMFAALSPSQDATRPFRRWRWYSGD